MASATKSFWGIAAAAMIEDGLLEFDEPARLTLGEWKRDAEKSKITIRHLLDLSSGLAEDIPAIQGYRRRETWAKDKYLHAVALPSATPAGSRFRYGPSHFYALGSVRQMRIDQSRDAKIARTLHPDRDTHYTPGAWVERVAPDGEARQIRDMGALGWNPWVDYERGCYAVFGTQFPIPRVWPLTQEIEHRIPAAVDGR